MKIRQILKVREILKFREIRNVRKTRNIRQIVAGSLIAAVSAAACSRPALAEDAKSPSGYHFAQTILLGGKGFWDYLAIDTLARHVFITNDTRVLVIDADNFKVLDQIIDPQIQGAHGVAIAKSSNRGFTSNGVTNTVTIFDLKTFKPLGTVKAGKHPDAIIYDSASKRVFVFNGESDDVTVIVPETGEVAATIALSGQPEFAGSDGVGGVFVNLEDKNEVVRIDARGLKVSDRWPTAPCEEPAGMAVDERHARLFLGCHNKVMAVMDSRSGKIVATPAIGGRVDANRFDPGTGLAFSSNGDGTLTVIHEDAPDKYSVLENLKTETGARTLEVDATTHTVYLVSADLTPTPPTADNPHPHPTVVPGTMRLLIYQK